MPATNSYRVEVFASEDNMIHGETEGSDEFDSRTEALKHVRRMESKGYWIELFAPDGELLYQFKPE